MSVYNCFNYILSRVQVACLIKHLRIIIIIILILILWRHALVINRCTVSERPQSILVHIYKCIMKLHVNLTLNCTSYFKLKKYL